MQLLRKKKKKGHVLNAREKTQNELHLVSKLLLQALALSAELKGPIPERGMGKAC